MWQPLSQLGKVKGGASVFTPTLKSAMSTPFSSAAAVSSFVILVMKFLALFADCVCMAVQMARVTRLVSAEGLADGLLIIPRRTLLLVFCFEAGQRKTTVNATTVQQLIRVFGKHYCLFIFSSEV